MVNIWHNKTLWARVGQIDQISIMGKTVLIFGDGCFLEFVNLNTGHQQNLTVNRHKVNGEGVKCYTGHISLLLFAYAEKSYNADIFVKSYPAFQPIVRFTGDYSGCKCLTFSESSLLFVLGEMPTYSIKVWNWRTNESFTEMENDLFYEDQKLTYGHPLFLSQLGIGSHKLYIWDVFTVCKKTILAKHKVKLGKLKPDNFQDMVWSMDSPTLYLIDSIGSIYTVDRNFYIELIIDGTFTEIPHSIDPSICWYHHGLMVSGPNPEIRHYKKGTSKWTCVAQYPTEVPLLKIRNGKTEKCIGHTANSEIVMFGVTPESVSFVRANASSFQYIALLNPVADFMIATSVDQLVRVYRVDNFQFVSKIKLENKILSIAENPRYPYIITGHEDGSIRMISFYDETKPVMLVKLSLADYDLPQVAFYEQGDFFMAGNKSLGKFIIMKGRPGTQIEVICQVNVGRQVISNTMVAAQNVVRFFVIPITNPKIYGGNEVWRYCIVDNDIVNIKKFQFDNGSVLYDGIVAKTGQGRDKEFYMIPHNSRHFVAVETKRGVSIEVERPSELFQVKEPTITISKVIKTGHQMKWFNLEVKATHCITYGYDGFAFVRSADLDSVEGMVLSQHRIEQGVIKALYDPVRHIVITIGPSKTLAAVQLDLPVDTDILQKCRDKLQEPAIVLMFKRPTFGFPIEARFTGKCWVEIQRLKEIEKENEKCRPEKEKIWAEFIDIQKVLRLLVDQNFEVPENKKLDLLEFYLDTATYVRKQQENKDECKETEAYLKALIVAQDKVSNFIIDGYYKPMGVQWQNIYGIFSEQKATNYCLLPENEARKKQIKWIEEQRKVEQFLSLNDSFEPWLALTNEEILNKISQRPQVPKDDYSALQAILYASSEREENEQAIETETALAGTVTKQYINKSTGHYKQWELETYFQSHLEQALVEREVTTLKQAYNKCFLNTRALKDREMFNIKEKNARLRHVISEYNYFTDPSKKIHIDFSDPEWTLEENVEADILRVVDSEVPIPPYISPSEQAILDAKAAEEERIRLLLLADDFRERALMVMMNGVLEIRWEDELKKDVPKPACMLEKDPADFVEEDLRNIRDYEEKVLQLKNDREKYKSLLEVEFTKISVALRDSIRKFNLKLYDCTKFKFYIDSGMNQENLVVNRQRVIQNERIKIEDKEQDIIFWINNYESTIGLDQEKVVEIQEAMVECRANMETMLLKEKVLEKAYKRDFQDMSPVIQEQAYKLYRRRPKVNFRVINTATIMNDLAKGVATNEVNFGITQECLDYLHALDALDSFAGLPPTIDEHVWALIVRHRRQRIEYEIRTRAAQIQIQTGDATISTFQKRLQAKKDKIISLREELEQTRQSRIDIIHNKQIQFVLRRGLVEILLTGDLYTDFEDAILIRKSEIEQVNELINNAGRLKLRTIEKNLSLKRTMMQMQWQHSQLRMQINDFIEELNDIGNVKFTKEMQNYLKNKNLGRKVDLESYEIEIELIITSYENRIKDKKDKFTKITRELNKYKESNKTLDEEIKAVNVDICLFEIEKDKEVEDAEKRMVQARLEGLLERNNLVHKIQDNHNDILILQAELELLRLRTFPVFKYKLLD